MVLNETEDYNTVGLWYSLQNQDKHSTVIPLSTSLLTQSIPDFKRSNDASSLKSICYFFPPLVLFLTSVLTLLKARCCSAGEVGYGMLGWLQAAGWQTALCLCVCVIALFCPGLPFPPHNACEVGWPMAGFWLLCHREAWPSLSTTWVMCSRQRPEVGLQQDVWGLAGCLKACLGCLSCGCALMQSSKLDFG